VGTPLHEGAWPWVVNQGRIVPGLAPHRALLTTEGGGPWTHGYFVGGLPSATAEATLAHHHEAGQRRRMCVTNPHRMRLTTRPSVGVFDRAFLIA
jgi:hypothetical protein